MEEQDEQDMDPELAQALLLSMEQPAEAGINGAVLAGDAGGGAGAAGAEPEAEAAAPAAGPAAEEDAREANAGARGADEDEDEDEEATGDEVGVAEAAEGAAAVAAWRHGGMAAGVVG